MAIKTHVSGGDVKYLTLGGYNEKLNKANPTEAAGYLIRINTEPSTFGDNKTKTSYILRTETGDVSVNGTTNLIRQMNEIEQDLSADGDTLIGAWVEFSYLKSEASKKGAPTKIFRVGYDIDDVLPDENTEAPTQKLQDTRTRTEALLSKKN